MKIRTLEPNEGWRATQVAAVCFEFPFNLEEERAKAEAMTAEEIEAAKNPPKTDGYPLPSDSFPAHTVWGCFSDDEKTLMGSIGITNYTCRFDGNAVLMGGIGGVSTLPAYRRGGTIRKCFEAALPDLYEKGFVFSTLYPFSRAYYRKFGYENGAFVRELTVDIEALPSQPVGGTIEQLFPGDDLSPLLEIYNEFYKTYNLSVYRREYDPALVKENLLAQQRYIYLWRNEQGKPRGFFISKKTDGGVLNCTYTFPLRNGFLALDVRAYQALFAFIRSAFAAHYQKVKFAVPDVVRLDSLFPEGNLVGIHLDYNGMVRVVHLEKALELCRCRGEGTLKIEVTDPQIPQNTGTWRMDFAKGQPNRVTKTNDAPDISMPVSAFAPLICGIRTAEELSMMPEVTVHNPDAPFESVFYCKPCFLTELF